MRSLVRTMSLVLLAAVIAVPANAVMSPPVKIIHNPEAPSVLEDLMRRSSPLVAVADDGSCYAVCKYHDGDGEEYTGTSGTGCDDACVAAADRCLKSGEGDCDRMSCAMPGCH